MQQIAGCHPGMNRTHCISFQSFSSLTAQKVSKLKDETTKVLSVHPRSHPLSLLGWIELLPSWLESLSGWLELFSWLAGISSWLAGDSSCLAGVSVWLAGVSS